MLNKIFTIIAIISCGSFLLSSELVKVSNKEKDKTENKQIERKKRIEKKKHIKKKKLIREKKQRPENQSNNPLLDQ